MADEIDIEEHDIMENPVIRNMFPDLSLLKKEMHNYYDEYRSTPCLKEQESICADISSGLVNGNKTNSCKSSYNIESFTTAKSESDALIPDTNIQSNKIILGSKPNKVSVDQTYFEKWVKPYQANVVLQDIKCYLQKSKRYCEICWILFPEPSDYEKHLQLFHYEECITNICVDKTVGKGINKHKCNVCANNFTTKFLLDKHMESKHKENSINNIDNIEYTEQNATAHKKNNENTTDLSNTCFHCKEAFETQKSLIDHLYDILQAKRKTTEIFPVLKSVIFKCNQCDINFVSSQIAASHSDHMEMLINWKCSICSRIFKKEDELSHERQHSVSNNFIMYNLGEIDVNRILFKCSKCLTHFSENNFLHHFRDCGLKIFKTAYCNICNILLDNELKTSHDFYHMNANQNMNQFTVIETEVISDNPVKCTLKEIKIQKNIDDVKKSFKEVKIVLKRIDEDDLLLKKLNITQRKRHVNTNLQASETIRKMPKLAYSYCKTCKCFLTKFRSAMHVQSRCTNLKRRVCIHCGLIFTSMSIVTHKKLHDKCKNLKLTNFSFYNLYNGLPMNPPTPEYPKCDVCGVHFLTEVAKSNHGCSEEAYLTCHICDMKLSEAAFKLHLMFHHYSSRDSETEPSKYVNSKVNFDNGSNSSNVAMDNEMNIQPCASDKLLQKSYSDVGEFIYTCRNCYVTVDTYDAVVEHCQGHCNVDGKETNTVLCYICTLKIDAKCYADHHDLHEKGNKFKELKFDSNYFPEENNLWVKHIFRNMPEDQVMEILSKSIYRFEGRIKMEIIQQGAPNLTVYKCDRCCCYIEPSSLFKHADNSCFKLRKHPCSFCGLPFNSSASREDHEKIHIHPDITLESYRIVLFNREQDKELNRSFCFRKRYVLYQCRNCCGIIDKHQSDIHDCDISDLKKCLECELLLYSKDYEPHAMAHSEFDSFNHKNMKVIILGIEKPATRSAHRGMKSNFIGKIYDYKMYRCNKCQLCIKNEKFIPKHSCYYGKPQSKCPKCCLYFSVSRLKTHMRSHERDPDFLRSNMTMISFDPFNWDQNENTTVKTGSEHCEFTDSNSDSDCDIVMNALEQIQNNTDDSLSEKSGVVEELAKVYKCVCGLHFLNEDSILRHFGVCRPNVKVSKQKCSKCNLLFTSNVLFTHMLAHHSSINRRYKYDIIEMTN